MLQVNIEGYTFSALNYIEYKELQQSLNLNSNEEIDIYINNLLQKKCEESININNISFAEKTVLFLHLMAISVVFDKTLQDHRENKVFNVSLSLNEFIKAYNIKNKILSYKNFVIELFPLSNSGEFKDNISQYIKTIDIGNITINFRDLNDTEVEEVLSSFSGDFVKFLKDEIEIYIKESCYDIFNITTKEDENMICSNILNKSYIIDIIKFLFKEDLMSIYKNIYNITRKLGFKFSDFYNITQSEMDIFINLYNEEVEKNSQNNDSTELEGMFNG